MTRLADFLTRWRWGIALVGFIAAGLLAAALLLTVMDSIEGRRAAQDGQRDALRQAEVQREFSARRIDDLIAQGQENAALIGGLSFDIAILRSQISSLGGVPVTPEYSESAPPVVSQTPTTTAPHPSGNPNAGPGNNNGKSAGNGKSKTK